MYRRSGILWLAAGVTAMAATLGFLVGASSSPVGGIAITAIFGITASTVSLMHQRHLTGSVPKMPENMDLTDAGLVAPRAEVRAQLEQLIVTLGRTLVIFVTFFATGIALGAYARFAVATVHSHQHHAFPWTGKAPPETAFDAVDWLIAAEKLRALGYDDNQIADIYQIETARGPGVAHLPLKSLVDSLPTPKDTEQNLLVYEPSIAEKKGIGS